MVQMFCVSALGANTDGWLSGIRSGVEGNGCVGVMVKLH